MGIFEIGSIALGGPPRAIDHATCSQVIQSVFGRKVDLAFMRSGTVAKCSSLLAFIGSVFCFLTI